MTVPPSQLVALYAAGHGTLLNRKTRASESSSINYKVRNSQALKLGRDSN